MVSTDEATSDPIAAGIPLETLREWAAALQRIIVPRVEYSSDPLMLRDRVVDANRYEAQMLRIEIQGLLNGGRPKGTP